MGKITYKKFIQETEQENILNVSDVKSVIDTLLRGDDNGEYEEFEEVAYLNSTRKKLRIVADLFSNMELKVYGNVDDFHNCAVPYAKANMYDCACKVLERGLTGSEASIDLLSDYILYGIKCRKYEKCEEYYKRLNMIPKKQWTWRAFSFSIDYLLDKANRILDVGQREVLQQTVTGLTDEFIVSIGTDQAYFDKAQVIRTFGSYNEETEETVLYKGIDSLKSAPRCALRLADILVDRGEYKEAARLIRKCCVNAFKPQPDINGSYSFLLSALCNASWIFEEHLDSDYTDCKDTIKEIYRDFNVALERGLEDIYKDAATTSIKVVAALTGYEYPYSNIDDRYEF